MINLHKDFPKYKLNTIFKFFDSSTKSILHNIYNLQIVENNLSKDINTELYFCTVDILDGMAQYSFYIGFTENILNDLISCCIYSESKQEIEKHYKITMNNILEAICKDFASFNFMKRNCTSLKIKRCKEWGKIDLLEKRDTKRVIYNMQYSISNCDDVLDNINLLVCIK